MESASTSQPVGRHRAAGRLSNGLGLRRAFSSTPVRLLLVTGATCCLGLVAFAGSQPPPAAEEPPPGALAERAAAMADQPASRATERAAAPTPTATPPPTRSATASPTPVRKPTKPPKPKPVAGLTQAQMDNANIIVQVGIKLKVPRPGLVVAVATAMQESNLYNLASEVLPESKNYPHQGTGFDHDSVGLFQQRTSTGWGAVKDLMRPAYAAQKFYEALLQVPGWQQLSLSAAAQAVQISAFPDAYAKHEARATTIVAALI
ncbi:hypothetical protein GCM10027290_05710 [Micromonospora sonneratiae]